MIFILVLFNKYLLLAFMLNCALTQHTLFKKAEQSPKDNSTEGSVHKGNILMRHSCQPLCHF